MANPVAEADVMAALRTVGLTPRTITDLGAWRSGRATYRITLDGGREIKARRHQGRTRGARAAAFARALGDAGFPAPVAVVDRVTIEEWVDGTPLSELRLTGELVDEAANLLGRLHAVTSLPHLSDLPDRPDRRVRSQQSTAFLWRGFDRQLVDLTDAGVLGAAERRRLATVARRGFPPVATRGLTHGDFCATNLVSVRDHALVCVDNEAVGFGFLDEDLARTWCRWPMPAWAWTRFRTRYARWGYPPATPPADLAWRAVSATRNAHRWHRARATPHDLPFGTLRRVLDESLDA